MRSKVILMSISILISGSFIFSQTGSVIEILSKNCVSCHRGSNPPKGLNLEPDNLLSKVVNIKSSQNPELTLVTPGDPDHSYILMKIRGLPGISGKRMPRDKDPLSIEDTKMIKDWISELSEEIQEKKNKTGKKREEIFQGLRVINLPTTRLTPKGHLLFRVSHRFIPSVDDGYKSFFGLNGPAVMFISFGYGISDNINITLGHGNLFHEWEFSLKWRLLQAGKGSGFPFSVSLNAGGDLTTVSGADNSTKYFAQLSMDYAVTPKISILVVPGYASDVNHFSSIPEGTFVLGTGVRVAMGNKLSIIGEWIPVLSGYSAAGNGWGLGAEYRVGKHVFQVFILNSTGITTDQYIYGGDLLFKNGDFRLGFNIFREF